MLRFNVKPFARKLLKNSDPNEIKMRIWEQSDAIFADNLNTKVVYLEIVSIFIKILK